MDISIKTRHVAQAALRASARHAEKGVLALSVTILALFAYHAARPTGLPWTPDDLIHCAKLVEGHVAATDPRRPEVVPRKAVDYRTAVRDGREPIRPNRYIFAGTWETSPFAPPRLREKPALLAVGELRTAAGLGVISANDSKDRRAHGLRWVAITTRIDYARQQEAFAKALRGSSHTTAADDAPAYCGYCVERAELVAGQRADSSGLTWVRLRVRDAMAVRDAWQSAAAEVVDDRCLLPQQKPPLAFPLPPLQDVAWQRALPRPAEIPLRDEGGAARQPDREVPASTLAEPSPYRLFRFFDFTTEPGKRYTYRVKLFLLNPNHGVAEQYLRDPSLAAAKYLETPWQQCAAVAAVRTPDDVQVLVSTTRKVRGRPPQAMLLIVRFDMDSGTETVWEIEARRGQLLNFPAGRQGTSAECKTDILVLDYRLTKTAGNRPHDVADVVLQLPDGSLIARNELDDARECKRRLDQRERNERPKGENTDLLAGDRPHAGHR